MKLFTPPPFFLLQRLLAILIVVFVNFNLVIAQNDSFCQTVPGPDSPKSIDYFDLNNFGTRGPTAPYYLKVYIHIIRDAQGNGGVPDSRANKTLEILNNDFSSHGIYFVWNCETEYIYSDFCAGVNLLANEYDSLQNLIELGAESIFSDPIYQHDDGIDISIPSNYLAGYISAATLLPTVLRISYPLLFNGNFFK